MDAMAAEMDLFMTPPCWVGDALNIAPGRRDLKRRRITNGTHCVWNRSDYWSKRDWLLRRHRATHRHLIRKMPDSQRQVNTDRKNHKGKAERDLEAAAAFNQPARHRGA